jgi:hypothetical protein
MARGDERWDAVSVPPSVAAWLRSMSERVGQPAHHVIRALLDRYIQCLPHPCRRKLDEILRSRRGGQ